MIASAALGDAPTATRAEGSSRPIAEAEPPVSMRSLVVGRRVGDYVVVGAIGQGGMGEVYEVEHEALGRRFVLKVLHRNHRGRDDLAARTREEARSLAALRHPNLVDVVGLGVTDDGRPYFAMELLRGRDLRKELARAGGSIAPARAVDLMIQALDGLSAAHAAGIVHRDVKLENLFLCEDGVVKLLDFGVAKIMSDSAPRSRRGVAIGTPRTMAPEQCAFLEVDPRTDVYAAGLALYELIAGRGPFDELRGNAHALRFAHCGRTPPPPSSFTPASIPAPIEAAILRAIAKAPDDRFQSAASMAEALRVIRGERRRTRVAAPPISDPPIPACDIGPTDIDPRASSAPGEAFTVRSIAPEIEASSPRSTSIALAAEAGALAATAVFAGVAAVALVGAAIGAAIRSTHTSDLGRGRQNQAFSRAKSHREAAL